MTVEFNNIFKSKRKHLAQNRCSYRKTLVPILVLKTGL